MSRTQDVKVRKSQKTLETPVHPSKGKGAICKKMAGSARKSSGKEADDKTPKKSRSSSSGDNDPTPIKENKNLTKKQLEVEVDSLNVELTKTKSLLNAKDINFKQVLSKLKTVETQYDELKELYEKKCKTPCPNCQARQMAINVPPQAPVWQAPPPQAPAYQPVQQVPAWQPMQPQAPAYQPVQQVPAWQPMQPQAPVWQPQAPNTWNHQPRPQYQGGYGYQGGRRRGGGHNKGWYHSYQPY